MPRDTMTFREPFFRLRRLLLAPALLLLAWVVLHSFALVYALPTPPSEQPLIAQYAAEPAAGDLLVVRVAVDSAPQHLPVLLTWAEGTRRRHSLALTLRADGRPATYTVPVGAHPGWVGAVRNVRLVPPFPHAQPLMVEHVSVVRRSALAPDIWIARGLYQTLQVIPPFGHLQLVLLAGSAMLVTLLLPWSHWRRRLALLGLVLAISYGMGTAAMQFRVLQTVVPAYRSVDTIQAAAQAPVYTAHPVAIDQLLALAEQLPAGPVLLLDVNPRSDLLHRARYLLYPRRVDVRNPHEAPEALPDLLADHYVAALQQTPTDAPPTPGWRRMPVLDGPLAVWQAPDQSPAPLQPTARWPDALIPLLGGIGLFFIPGWALARTLGWRRAVQVGAAWPLGAALITWWMWLLDISGGAWSVWMITAPLLISSGLGLWAARRAPDEVRSDAFHMNQLLSVPTTDGVDQCRRWSVLLVGIGWIVLAVFTGSVTLQAVLLPFTDRDSWTMWGLKGQAFFLDQSIEPVLTMYRGIDVHHSSYPPAQPLLQTWLYLTMGGINERLVKVLFPGWYLAGVLLIWGMCRRWMAPLGALGWALLLATMPLYLDHATLGNADLPLAIALLLGGIALIGWLETGSWRMLIGGAIALGAAAWIKLDGSYLGAGMLFAAGLVRLMSVHADPLQRRRTLLHIGLTAGIFVALIVPWVVYTQILGLNDLPSMATYQPDRWRLFGEGLVVLTAEVLFSYNNSSLGLLGGSYGLFWLICCGAVVIGWRRIGRDPLLTFLLLTVVGGFIFYLAVYTIRPYYSVERYILHLAPLALLAAARASLGALKPTVAPDLVAMRPIERSQAVRKPLPAPTTRRSPPRKGRRT